ncbi:hypothetical protein ZYGR_0N03650 [Zygosaccharomyces rouxii]|uniref:Ankyrin repeat-containing protein YCR051W n=1 Tax=Zygosaccharomyces rouxii TaxID=4956 RepID=B2G3Y2_ZYGRO|nr:hypothetical protein ZYGR_0N03650 [Zygosaccharomyces rouxii]CAQ43291.1 Ankyrin repeat-containing protein YCR051W [Zygosaccharomyces rouxii]
MNVWIAASDGRTSVVEKLLQENYQRDGNVKDPNGYTPVHAAAAYGHIELLRKLCQEYGGNINVKDSDGDTPLHHCEDAHTAKVILEELGGDISLQNEEGKTALQSAEEDGEFPELIQYLRIKSGISADEDSLGIDADQWAQFKDNIRYTMESEPASDDPESMARRQRLEEILSGDNPEEELQSYIREVIRSHNATQDDAEAPDTKRRK